MSTETGSVPKFVIVRFFGRHVSEESADITDDPPRTHFNEDLAIASSLPVRMHMRDCPPRAFRALDSVGDVTHATICVRTNSLCPNARGTAKVEQRRKPRSTLPEMRALIQQVRRCASESVVAASRGQLLRA